MVKIYRPSMKVVEISDLAVEIACALANGHLLNSEYLHTTQFDNMTKEQKSIFLVEEVGIKIDDILQRQSK